MFVFIVIFSLLEIITLALYFTERAKNKGLAEEHREEIDDMIRAESHRIDIMKFEHTAQLISFENTNNALKRKIFALEEKIQKYEKIAASDESILYVSLLEMITKYQSCKCRKEITELIDETASKIKLNFSKNPE